MNYTRTVSSHCLFDVAMKPSPVPWRVAITWKATLVWRRLRSPMSRRCQLQTMWVPMKVKRPGFQPKDWQFWRNDAFLTALPSFFPFHVGLCALVAIVCRRRAIKSRSNLYCTSPGGIFELEYVQYHGTLRNTSDYYVILIQSDPYNFKSDALAWSLLHF